MTLALDTNALPASTAWLFPEYDFAAIEPEGYAGVIIERILERGTWDELRWLFARYGEPRIREWCADTAFGCSASARLPSGDWRWTCRTTSRRTGHGKRRRWSRGRVSTNLRQRLPAAKRWPCSSSSNSSKTSTSPATRHWPSKSATASRPTGLVQRRADAAGAGT